MTSDRSTRLYFVGDGTAIKWKLGANVWQVRSDTPAAIGRDELMSFSARRHTRVQRFWLASSQCHPANSHCTLQGTAYQTMSSPPSYF